MLDITRRGLGAAPVGPSPSRWRVLVNFAAFEIAWFACVLGAARGMPLLGVAVAATAVVMHAFIAPHPGRELALVMTALVIGAAFDSSLAASGWILYAPGEFVPRVAPHWILALWALFATTLNVSLRWLRGRTAFAALLGAVAGPLSYYGGARLGALQIVQAMPAFVALALGWAIVTPALAAIAHRLDGVRRS